MWKGQQRARCKVRSTARNLCFGKSASFYGELSNAASAKTSAKVQCKHKKDILDGRVAGNNAKHVRPVRSAARPRRVRQDEV